MLSRLLIRSMVCAVVTASLASASAETALPPSSGATFEAALTGSQRSAKFVTRDVYRHPAEELAFFGLRPDMSVVEVWPGGGYWTEILAPVMRERGRYELALPSRDPSIITPIERKLSASPAIYDKVMLGTAGKSGTEIAPAQSVDLILSFRNVHNWMADDYAPGMFAAFFRALKHDGVLGIEEHRGNRVGVWRRVQAVNVEPIVHFTKAFVPAMAAAGWGRIVTTGSSITLNPQSCDLAYITSKSAVHGVTKALANDLGDKGITVNSIAPTVVKTEGFDKRLPSSGPSPDELMEQVVSQQTIKRSCLVKDVADALAFLVSDDAGFITGQIIHVDGGRTRSGA